ncbi:MAG TPA: MopE-related protein, partial [Myxococcota bacterium]|nr:MopE-related protein [Myxococcota bacterium]
MWLLLLACVLPESTEDTGQPCEPLTWHADGDADGFGELSSSQLSCTQPPGFVADATDCDDGAAAAFPGAPETCDGLDNNCDGTIDESSAIDAGIWYADGDGDGF